MLAAALLLLLPLAGSRALIEQTSSTDSAVRSRAAYALARIHDRSDSASRAKVEELLSAGTELETRLAVIRGLFSRGWKNEGGMPAGLEAKLTILLADPEARVRAVAVDGVMLLPRETALPLLRKEEPQSIARVGAVEGMVLSPFGFLFPGQGVPPPTLAHWRVLRALYMLDDKVSAPVIRDEVRRRNTSRASRVGCLVDDWSDDLAVLVWLGEDISPVVSQCGRDGVQPTLSQANTLLRLEAVRDRSATGAFAERLTPMMDPATRRELFRWLLELPPTVRPEAWPFIEGATGDPDLMVHDGAARVLSSHALAVGDGAVTGTLGRALTSLDPAGRVEALGGLFDLAQAGNSGARAALLSAAKVETEPDLKAALELATERLGATTAPP